MNPIQQPRPGCMIADLVDYRPPKGNDTALLDAPERSRVLLRPTVETFAADILRVARNAGVTSDTVALELEAKILVGYPLY